MLKRVEEKVAIFRCDIASQPTHPRIEKVHVPGDVDKLFTSDPKNVSLSAGKVKLIRKQVATAGTSASDGAIASIQRA
jgi:hypothetical protein